MNTATAKHIDSSRNGLYEYIDHLYSRNMDGYVQIIQKRKGEETPIIKSGKKGNILEMAEKMTGYEDVAISPNTFYIPVRRSRNIRHFRALYVDLDLEGRNINFSKTEAVYQAYMRAEEGRIPRPTMVVDSGRGVHLYWRIEDAPYQAWHTWQALEDYLYYQFRDMGADRAVTDSARVLRLPGTFNSKNGAVCEVMYVEDNIYSMYDLRKEYLNYTPKKSKSNNISAKRKVSHLYNSYALHLSRAKDIETLCALRNYDMKGHRNTVLHMYAYWKGISIRSSEELFEVVQNLNLSFVEPHKEIRTMIRSVDRAIERFIEDGSKGYNYKNETLIEMLDISEEEQKYMSTIIGKEEKYRRNNARRRKERRDEGLTSRERQKQENIKAVAKMYNQGHTQKEIAQKLGLSKGRVSQIINYEL